MKLEFEFMREATLNSNDRFHYQVKAKRTKALRAQGRAVGLKKQLDHLRDAKTKFKPFSKVRPCTVDILLYSPTRRKLDPPNFYPTVKALIDGLTDAGLWVDDNHEVIQSMAFKYGGLSGSKAYRLEIRIDEA